MKLDQLNRLAVFAEIVETGGISAAARRLGIVKSSVSYQLAELERELGQRLLDRSPSGVTLTPAGAILHQHARVIRSESRQALQSLREAEAPRGTLRISMPSGVADDLVVPLLAGFLERYPGIALDVLATDEILALDKAGVDLAFRFGWIEDSRYVARRLSVHEDVLVAAPSYLAGAPPLASPFDLERHSWIGFAGFGSPQALTLADAGGRQVEVTLSCRVRTTSAASIKSWAAAGLGVARLPGFVARAELADGRLARVLPDWALRGGELYAVYAPARHRPANLARLIDHLDGVRRSAQPDG